MSLGLKDLQKKRRALQANLPPDDPEAKATGGTGASSSAKIGKMGRPGPFASTYASKPFAGSSSGARTKMPAGAWAGRGITARPWTDTGLAKSARGRKSPIDNDAAMNEDWINLFSTPWFWVECSPGSRLIRLQQHLAKIEEQIQQKLQNSFAALRNFWK